MAEGRKHNQDLEKLFGKEFASRRKEHLEAIQDAVYLITDATIRDKNSQRITKALNRLRDWKICDTQADDVVTKDSVGTAHQYYGHLGYNYNYEVDALNEQKKTEEWGLWDEKQKNDFRQHLAVCQKRFSLTKDILDRTLSKIFPTLSSEKITALSQICYLTHIYGDLRYNESPKFLMDIQDYRNDFIKSIKKFVDGNIKAEIEAEKVIQHIESSIPVNLNFQNGTNADNISENDTYYQALDRAMNPILEKMGNIIALMTENTKKLLFFILPIIFIIIIAFIVFMFHKFQDQVTVTEETDEKPIIESVVEERAVIPITMKLLTEEELAEIDAEIDQLSKEINASKNTNAKRKRRGGIFTRRYF